MSNHFEEMEKKRLQQKKQQKRDKEAEAARAVGNAKASLEMDGMEVSPETEDIMMRFARGELTEREVLELIKPRKTD
ncbi:antitoxin VbhA family protein [Paenibacillus allorhizosphaerae]|uniref:Antitoxin VbhA domain-containing protein n=1 Tax=Paenibacillus allorhizosphaerae TaxID=2849866 RepID=A0ABM8VI45_9BACL|nr:antitoxin VbhA family protein [Paenibacillus allorhizosphaerae]CAG7643587.1 hypothetical protein PAECIP111802_03051 [Paenibacillus allorhizosphaerae]